MKANHVEALKLALEALENATSYGSLTGADWVFEQVDNAITAIKQALALDKKAENARELGLDYEPVWCGHCNGSGRMVRDPDIGTDQECFVCDGAGVPAAPVQEPADGTQVSKVWWDGEKLMAKPIPLVDFYQPVQDSTCSETLRAQGKAYPRTCRKCGLGPCIGAPKQPPAAQRQWVGLTQQDIDIAFDDTQEGGGFDEFARAIEAKLKEKNT